MPSIEMMGLAHDSGFQRRVKHFMQKSAIAIMGEVSGPRTDYAKAVLDGSASTLEMAISVVTDAAVAAAGTDATSATELEVETAVTDSWNAMSGVTG